MKPRQKTIRLRTGDVRMLRISCGKHVFHLVVYDEDTAVPLIRAKLNEAERQAIRKALSRDN